LLKTSDDERWARGGPESPCVTRRTLPLRRAARSRDQLV